MLVVLRCSEECFHEIVVMSLRADSYNHDLTSQAVPGAISFKY